MEFDWDSAKAKANSDKHGITFPDAVNVVADPRVMIMDVTRLQYGESRFKAVGMVDDLILAVIFTDRGTVRRIISARRSRTNERRDYDRQGAAFGGR